jgi:hypothetical protein
MTSDPSINQAQASSRTRENCESLDSVQTASCSGSVFFSFLFFCFLVLTFPFLSFPFLFQPTTFTTITCITNQYPFRLSSKYLPTCLPTYLPNTTIAPPHTTPLVEEHPIRPHPITSPCSHTSPYHTGYRMVYVRVKSKGHQTHGSIPIWATGAACSGENESC